MKKTLLVSASFALLLPLIASTQTSALSGSDFKAGRIIDDVIFYNKSSMTPQQIQDFLNAKVPVCDRTRPSSNPSYQPPWTCLKEYQENTTTKQNNIGQFNPDGTPKTIAGGKSAAQIIWDIGQKYEINPQVLIVMLQKEQSLITDNWPWKIQYDRAMGYACPDTAPCDLQYYGFYNQVDSAAWQLKRYIQYPDSYNFKSGVTRYIQYNPNTSCGGSNVFIENGATAALYNYTPYQPNAGALANLYGTSTCGAYGNRNFWRMFNEWFGSTLTPSFNAQLYSQSAFPTVRQGQTINAYLSFKNLGSVPWWDSRKAKDYNQFPIHLATASPTNRLSPFSASWTNGGRVSLTFTKVYESDGKTLSSDQSVVMPGQIAKYEFKFTIPHDTKPGIYRESFFPVREGTTSWYIYGLSWLDINVLPADRTLSFAGQSNFPSLKAGESAEVYFKLKNNGNVDFYDSSSAPKGISPLHLATYNNINRKSAFAEGWVSKERPSIVFSKIFESNGSTLSDNQHVLKPGQVAEFRFNMKAPDSYTSQNTYREFFMPILEGAKEWNLNRILWQDIRLQESITKLKFKGQSAFPTIARGGSGLLYLNFQNVGNTIIYDSSAVPAGKYPLRLATFMPTNRNSEFNARWDAQNRPKLNFSKVYEADGTTLTPNQHILLPDQIVRMEIPIDVPADHPLGKYREFFTPAFEWSPDWYTGIVAWQDITVIQ